MLEITCGYSGLGALQRADELFNIFPDSEYLPLVLVLSFGDITSINEITKREIDNESFKDIIKLSVEKLLKLTNIHKKIRIWTSKSVSEDYFTLLFALDLLKDKDIEISVVFADEALLKSKNNEYYSPYSLSYCSEQEVQELLKIERKLSNDETKNLLEDWNKLKSENSPIRIVRNKKGLSVAEDYFDDLILDVLKIHEKVVMARCIGEIIGKYGDYSGHLGDYIFKERIIELIDQGKIIEIQKGEPKTMEKDGFISDGRMRSIIRSAKEIME